MELYSLGKEYGYPSKSYGKPMQDFKVGNDKLGWYF